MGQSKSRGSKSTEQKFRAHLIRSGVNGWKLGHRSGLVGSPDIVFDKARLAIFLDGCFWHGCRRCRSVPVANRAFWLTKITRNKTRDHQVRRALRAGGWRVMRVWEHELRGGVAKVL